MSATLTATRPSVRPAPVQNPSFKPQRSPQPYVVPKYKKSEELKRHNRRLARALILTGSLIFIMLLRQFVFIMTASNAYEIADLSRQLKEISQTASSLQEQSQIYNSPQNLDKLARDLGMVPSDSVAFLRLSDGAIMGQPSSSAGDSMGKSLVDNYVLNELNAKTAEASNVKTNNSPAKQPVILTNQIPAPNTH